MEIKRKLKYSTIKAHKLRNFMITCRRKMVNNNIVIFFSCNEGEKPLLNTHNVNVIQYNIQVIEKDSQTYERNKENGTERVIAKRNRPNSQLNRAHAWSVPFGINDGKAFGFLRRIYCFDRAAINDIIILFNLNLANDT